MFIDIVNDILREFFNSFKVVRGRNQYLCTLITFIYLLIALASSIFKAFTFISVYSCLIALVVNLILTFITAKQLDDIDRVKKYVSNTLNNTEGGSEDDE